MALGAFPSIVPASVLGANAPSNRVNVGAIGTGRISRVHDMPGVWKYDHGKIIAVCDLDTKRAQDAKVLVNGYYSENSGKPYDGVTVYHDYRELLQNRDVDAVIISTKTEALYANGVKMVVSNELPNGIKFEGTAGWIFVRRGNYQATASDPVANAEGVKPLDASDPKIIKSVIGPEEIHLYESRDQHGNWLESVKSRKPPIAPIEVGHRSCSACLIHHIAMKLKRKVYWNPAKEQFRRGRGKDKKKNKFIFCRLLIS